MCLTLSAYSETNMCEARGKMREKDKDQIVGENLQYLITLGNTNKAKRKLNTCKSLQR
jgi:hypothetical protein